MRSCTRPTPARGGKRRRSGAPRTGGRSATGGIALDTLHSACGALHRPTLWSCESAAGAAQAANGSGSSANRGTRFDTLHSRPGGALHRPTRSYESAERGRKPRTGGRSANRRHRGLTRTPGLAAFLRGFRTDGLAKRRRMAQAANGRSVATGGTKPTSLHYLRRLAGNKPLWAHPETRSCRHRIHRPRHHGHPRRATSCWRPHRSTHTRGETPAVLGGRRPPCARAAPAVAPGRHRHHHGA